MGGSWVLLCPPMRCRSGAGRLLRAVGDKDLAQESLCWLDWLGDGKEPGPVIRARRAGRNCRLRGGSGSRCRGVWRPLRAPRVSWVRKAKGLTLSPAFCRLRSRSASRALIQQDTKACNFGEFLEIGLLPISSYSHTPRLRSCSGSLLGPSSAGCFPRSARQKRGSRAAISCLGRDKERRDPANVNLQRRPVVLVPR